MGPTTIPPPSPEKPPPPPPGSSHVGCKAIVSLEDEFYKHQKGETSNSRNMDNFKALVLKFTRSLLPAQQSIIEKRLDDFFPDQLLVPDHPTYAAMIQMALWKLNEEGGSTEEAISDFIKNEHQELPWAHATILKHNLRELCVRGEIIVTHDKRYLRRSSITKLPPRPSPSPSPSPCHSLTSYSPSSSPISSTPSSSSGSHWSSPSSSSTSFCWNPDQEYDRSFKRKRKKKEICGRRPKENQVRGRGKAIQVRGRGRRPKTIHVRERGSGRGRGRGRGRGSGIGRGRGRGRLPKMIQVSVRGTPPNDTKDIQKRRRGRPSKKEKIGEKYRAEEEQVDLNPIVTLVVEEENQRKGPERATDDKTEVMGKEIEENLKQDEEQDVIVRIGQQGLEDGAGKEQNQPEKQKNDVIPCERHKEVTEELGRPQKLYKVTWVGCRGHIKGKIASVEQRPSRSEQNAVSKEENQPSEQDKEGTKRQCHQWKQYNVTWIGCGVRKFTESGKDFLEEQSKAEVIGLEEDIINEEHNAFSGDTEEDIHLEGLRQREAKGVDVKGLKRIEKNGARLGCNQEDWKHDVVEQQISQQEQLMIKMSENIQMCSQQERAGMEPEVEVAEKLQKEQPQNEVLQESFQLEDKVMEQDSLNVRNEAQKDGSIEEWNGHQKQVKGASVDQIGSQLQQIDATREHFDLQERSMEKVDDTCQSCGQLQRGSMEKVDDTCQSCGQLQRGSMEKHQLEEREVEMPGEVMDEIREERDPVMIKCEAQVRGTSVETESEEQHDNVTGEQIQPLVQSTKAKEVLSHGEQDRVSSEQEMMQQQVEMDGEPHQHEEQQHKVIQKEQGLMDEDPEGEAQVQVASIEQIESEEQHGYLTEEQVQANEQFTEGSKEGLQLFGQQQIGKAGEEMLEKQVETAGERHQHEEPQNKKIQKERVLMDEDTEKPQETELIQTESQVRGVNLAPNKLEEQHDDVAEEQVQPQARCMESTPELLTGQQHGESIGQEMQEKQVEMAGESYEVKRKERLLMDGIIEEQGVVMSQSETKLRDASVEQHETEDQEGTKEEFQPYGKHQIGKIEKELLGKQAEMACEPHQHEERQTEMTQKERVLMGGDTEEPQDAMMIQSEAQERGASLELNELKEQHDNVIEELVQPQERHIERTDEKLQFWGHDRVKDGEFESAEEPPQQVRLQTEIIQKEFMPVNEVTEVQQDVLVNQSEGQVKGECLEQNESDEHQCVTGKHVGLQEDCMEGRKEEFLPYGQHRDIMEQVQLGNGEAEIPGGGHQQEQSSEMKEKHIGLVNELCDIQQGLVIMQSKAQGEGASAEHNESETHQDQLEEREIEIAEEQPQGQDNKVLQKEIEIMNHLTEVTQDPTRTQHEAQIEGTSVKFNEPERKRNNTTIERVASQDPCMEGTKEEIRAIKELNGQPHEEKEAILEKIQKEECENGVTVQRCYPQEQRVEEIKERPVQQTEISEKENQPQGQCVEISSERTGSSDGIVKSSRAFPLESPDVEKLCLSHHQNRDEQRQPSRLGLRSRSKKQEGNPNAEVIPVRRSPRLCKTNLEATTATEGVDSFGGPPKKKPRNAAA